MKIFSVLTIALLIIFQAVGFAATGTFSASGEYLMSDYDTPEIAEEIALDFAKQSAAEQAGVYLESYSRTVNFELEADEIKTVASSKVEVLEKNISRQFQRDGRILLRADIRAKVDTSELDAFLQQERQQRQLVIQQYKMLQEMNDKIKQDIETFQAKLAVIKDEVKDDDLIVEQERINREFLSKQALDVINLKRAIKLNPKEFRAYTYQSFLVKSNLDKLSAVNKSIILNPNYGLNYMYRGEYYQNLGDINNNREMYARAVENYSKVIERKSEDEMDHLFFYNVGWLYYNRAESYNALEDYDHAIEDYLQVTKLPAIDEYEDYISLARISLRNAYLSRAENFNEKGDYANAVKDYTRLIANDPKDAYAYGKRADIYMIQKDYDKAIADYDKAIKFEDDSEIKSYYVDDKRNAVNAKRGPKKKEELAKKFAGVKPNDKKALWKLTKTYEEKEDYDLAIEGYTRLINLDANDAEAYSGRGGCYIYKGNYSRALEDYNQAIKLNPENVSDYADRATCHEKMGNFDLALADYDQITKIDPEYPNAYNWRADIYMKRGEYDKAFADYDKAYEVEKDTDDKHTRLRIKTKAILTRAENYMKQGEYDKAVADYDTAFKMTDDEDNLFKNQYLAARRNALYEKTKDIRYLDTPVRYADFMSAKGKKAFVNALLKHGDSYLDEEEYALAIADYSQAINVEPNNEKALKNRAYAYRESSDYKNSIEDYTRVIDLEPNYQHAYFWRAWLYDELGENEKALLDLNKLLELNPNYSGIAYNNRAVAHENLGDLEKALVDYNKAIELEPDNETFKNNRQNLLDKMKK